MSNINSNITTITYAEHGVPEIDLESCNIGTEGLFVTIFLVYLLCVHLKDTRINKTLFGIGYCGVSIGLTYGYFREETIDKFSILAGFLFQSFHFSVILFYGHIKCNKTFDWLFFLASICYVATIGGLLFVGVKTLRRIKSETEPIIPQ